MKTHLSVIAAAFLLLLAAGCGQTGPLYLPGNPSTVQPPAEQQGASEEDEEETGDSASP
ncbi:MAG: LPS translocon maturation chaperone LptM [Woeseiaceae bacterium]|jgi:predicted small lipoprotein YifL